MYTQRRLAVILKIRCKLTPFFFAILEDSNITPIIGTEIREQYHGSFIDFNLTDEKNVYGTTFQILNRRATLSNRSLQDHPGYPRILKSYMQRQGMVLL